MFKKVGIATALSATVLFGGAFVSDVEASANSGPFLKIPHRTIIL